MTVVYLDLCHQCDRPIAAGIFCTLCLPPAVAAGAPTDRGRPAAPAGSWDGAPTGAAVESSAPRLTRTSGVHPAASTVATTRKKNAPGVDVSGVDREGAPTTPAA